MDGVIMPVGSYFTASYLILEDEIVFCSFLNLYLFHFFLTFSPILTKIDLLNGESGKIEDTVRKGSNGFP